MTGLNASQVTAGTLSLAQLPAAVVTKYLAEHGIIVEKTGLYSFFIMFTIGITKGRWNTLVTALQQFKDDYDKNQPLWKVLPEFVQKNPNTCRALVAAIIEAGRWIDAGLQNNPNLQARRYLLESVQAQQASRILEVGCGTGQLTRHILRRWPGHPVDAFLKTTPGPGAGAAIGATGIAMIGWSAWRGSRRYSAFRSVRSTNSMSTRPTSPRTRPRT